MTEPVYGVFTNGIPYARFGQGEGTMLVFSGGPGNRLPTGIVFEQFAKGLAPFLEDYTLHLVSRRSGLPEGYTTRDMAKDYAQMIQEEFEGHVDVVMGFAYGGLVAQHFAADHPDLFDHIVIAGAAHKISPIGRDLDWRFAELLSRGKDRSAYALIATAMYPRGIKRAALQAMMWLMAGTMGGVKSETFEQDVLIEARAELEHDATDSLSRITIPVLIVSGVDDVYFPPDYVQEMGDLVAGSMVKLYAGQGVDLLSDERFAQDLFGFIQPSSSPSNERLAKGES